MTGIQLPGLATGLDSASLIASLMQLYAAPENVIKAKITTDNSKISDLQYLNTQLAALKTAADTNAKPAALAAFTTSASSTAITAQGRLGRHRRQHRHQYRAARAGADLRDRHVQHLAGQPAHDHRRELERRADPGDRGHEQPRRCRRSHQQLGCRRHRAEGRDRHRRLRQPGLPPAAHLQVERGRRRVPDLPRDQPPT